MLALRALEINTTQHGTARTKSSMNKRDYFSEDPIQSHMSYHACNTDSTQQAGSLLTDACVGPRARAGTVRRVQYDCAPHTTAEQLAPRWRARAHVRRACIRAWLAGSAPRDGRSTGAAGQDAACGGAACAGSAVHVLRCCTALWWRAGNCYRWSCFTRTVLVSILRTKRQLRRRRPLASHASAAAAAAAGRLSRTSVSGARARAAARLHGGRSRSNRSSTPSATALVAISRARLPR